MTSSVFCLRDDEHKQFTISVNIDKSKEYYLSVLYYVKDNIPRKH